MTMLQVMIGIGIGILGLILLTPRAIEWGNYSNSRNRKNSSDYWSPPGEKCVICLVEMDSDSMQYLPCRHALHENCLKELRKTSSLCPICRTKF